MHKRVSCCFLYLFTFWWSIGRKCIQKDSCWPKSYLYPIFCACDGSVLFPPRSYSMTHMLTLMWLWARWRNIRYQKLLSSLFYLCVRSGCVVLYLGIRSGCVVSGCQKWLCCVVSGYQKWLHCIWVSEVAVLFCIWVSEVVVLCCLWVSEVVVLYLGIGSGCLYLGIRSGYFVVQYHRLCCFVSRYHRLCFVFQYQKICVVLYLSVRSCVCFVSWYHNFCVLFCQRMSVCMHAREYLRK